MEVARPRANELVLSYVVTGNIGGLRLPKQTAATRTDELWRHTCFEAFLRPSPAEAYFEFNVAPSTQWAAYGFSGYRNGMRVAKEIGAPRIEVQSSSERFSLQASLDLERLVTDAVCQLGLSAVIEETNGNISYWALAHPPGKADFHHSDCFALELTRA